MMKRTYIDASVMIAAFRGDESTARRAMAVLDDPERTLVVSDYLRLEVTPKPTFYNKSEEVNFMLVIFEKAAESVHPSTDLINRALEFAARYDLSPLDALHAGASALAEVHELVTMEKNTKPICSIQEIVVVSLHST